MKSQFNTQKFIERLGMYCVDGQKYHNAFEALMKSKTTGKNMYWDFNDSTFSNINWAVPINTPLDELYRLRLLQLRNEYDHLILFFSGGRDSMNIINIAIKNKIFIDEIVMFYPFDLKKYFNQKDTSSDNNFSEIEYAAKPFLQKKLNDLDKRTKIRYMDLANANIKMFMYDDWFEKMQPNYALTVANRATATYFDEDIVSLAMNGKHVALVYGIDKPRITNLEGKFYASFSDVAMHAASKPKIKDKSEMFDKFIFFEAFYWTPYLPELAIKQAQVALAVINSKAYKNLFQQKSFVFENNSMHFVRERIMCDYLYSDKENPWQTLKPSSTLDKKLNAWFWHLAPEKAKNNLISGMNSIKVLFNEKDFIDGKIKNGKKISVSKHHFLGNSS